MDQDKVKMEIIWQIASYPGIKKRPLIEQARRTLRLTSDEPLETQLKWLTEKGIIYSEPASSGAKTGPAASYRICQAYNAFTYSYDLFKKRNCQKDFLKTMYSIEYTSSRGFLSKLLMNIFKASILELNDQIEREGLKNMIEQIKGKPMIVTAEEWRARMKNRPESMSEEEYRRYLQEVDEIKRQAHKKFVRSLRHLENNDASDEFVTSYKLLISDLKNNDVDALPAIIAERLGRAGNPEFGSYDGFLADYMLPDYEQTNISLMLSLSPSAIEYALYPKYPSSTLLASMASLMLNTVVPPEFFKPISQYDIEALYNGDVSPLYSVIKSAFIYDLMNDRLIVKRGAEILINEIFARKRIVRIANVPAEHQNDKARVEQ